MNNAVCSMESKGECHEMGTTCRQDCQSGLPSQHPLDDSELLPSEAIMPEHRLQQTLKFLVTGDAISRPL